jgi:LysR family glycine cleavage system transcriptional activator
MSRRLPPLNGLRAFEATARLMSFTGAARELSVTQAAISLQIKALEVRLGTRLFERNRQLELSAAGQALFPSVRLAFDTIAEAVGQLRTASGPASINVSTIDSFASWLLPRLRRFRKAHPTIEVRITVGQRPIDFRREDVDLAVRYGNGTWKNLESVLLMNEELFPACSPSLLETGPAIERPEDLLGHNLLHDEMDEEWHMWFRAAGVPDAKANKGPRFQTPSLVIQAAIAGEGIALAHSVLAAEDIAAGRLVRLFTVSLPAQSAYYVVYPGANAERPGIAEFRDWLKAEAAQDQLVRGGPPSTDVHAA